MTMKNGFSTINRLLGKQRDSSSNLSKSTTNLSVTKSTVNINDSSQLHQNRITPLPIATSNAPFEQTFRITVLLPRDQLYVARLGARVRLEKLLQLVCENKQLDADKYEFQHPADPSQIFSCDQTIGAVGLSEIRLCNKSSDYNNTLRVDGSDNSPSRRNSFSSSKFSRNSKNISNTPSLYSSNYSLNSMGSSGVDSANFRNISPEVTTTKQMAPVVPTRKKRLAPRPPSQNLSVYQTQLSETLTTNSESSIGKTDFPPSSAASTPDPPALEQSVLSTNDDFRKSNISIDCNGNTKGSLKRNEHCSEQCQETQKEVMLKSQSTLCIATSGGEFNSEAQSTQPAPSPRRRVQTLPPKKPALTTTPAKLAIQTPIVNIQEEEMSSAPKSASPEALEPLSVNSKNVSRVFMNQNPNEESESERIPEPKVLVEDKKSNDPISEERNKPTSVEPTSLGPIFVVKESIDPMEPIELEQKDLRQSKQYHETPEDPSWNSAASTPIMDAKHDKSFVESSSEDDEAIKVYDLKLGKTIVKTLSNHKTTTAAEVVESSPRKTSLPENDHPDLGDSSEKNAVNGHIFETSKQVVKSVLEVEMTVSPVGSPVPEESTTKEETSVIERELNNREEKDQARITQTEEKIIEELLEEPREKLEEVNHIESPPSIPKTSPEILTSKTEGFDNLEKENKKLRENCISPETPVKQQPLLSTLEPETSPEILTSKTEGFDNLEKENKKSRENCISPETPVKQQPLLSTLERLGADEEIEFKQHMKAAELEIELINESTKHNLAARSSSFRSLSQFESAKNQRNQTTNSEEYFNRGRRRSSSELSIGESPSLQSIGVIKSILLNSRKNSLNGSAESTKSNPKTECDIQTMEEPSPKSNNNVFITNTTTTTINKAKPSSEEKIYRYSGPPNIQFSTWSERPKIQVAIKDEQDCVVEKSKNGAPKPVSNGKTDLDGLQRNTTGGSVLNLVTLRENRPSNYSNNSFEQEVDKTEILRPKFAVGSRTSWMPTTTSSSIANSAPQNNRPQLRPTSMITQNNSITNHVTANNTQPIFGQGTLRKTGFKEKIIPSPTEVSEVDGSKPIIPAFTLKNQTKPQITPKTPIRIETTTPPCAPPPPPIIRAVLTKQKTTNRPQMERSISVDPRDQLLSAIRNFKRDELKECK